jgi:hypothetical protein
MAEIEITKEEFADKIAGRKVRNIEFGDSDPSHIAIHLSDGETLFVGASAQVSMSEVRPVLFFEQYAQVIDGTAERIA